MPSLKPRSPTAWSGFGLVQYSLYNMMILDIFFLKINYVLTAKAYPDVSTGPDPGVAELIPSLPQSIYVPIDMIQPRLSQ